MSLVCPVWHCHRLGEERERGGGGGGGREIVVLLSLVCYMYAVRRSLFTLLQHESRNKGM